MNNRYDIVWPIWKHIAAGKAAGLVLRTNLNTSDIFGMSAKSFIEYAFTNYGVKVNLKESTQMRDAFFELYPEAKQQHDYIWSNYKKPTFYVETALGRRVKPRLGTDGINIPVQGTGAETTKLAVHYLIKEHPQVTKYLYNVVHDAVYLRVPKNEKDYWYEQLSKAMIKGWDEIRKTKAFKFKDIKMEVDV